jgi:alcohol oxidase
MPLVCIPRSIVSLKILTGLSDIAAKIRIPDNDIASLGSQYEEEWKRDFAPYPTKPALLCGIINAFLADPSLVTPGQYITFGAYTAYPYSRGSIHITSPTDVLTGYEFDAGFLNHPSDLATQVWAYKMSRRIVRRLPYFQGELELGHPKFPAGSKAGLLDLTTPESPEAHTRINDEIDYTAEDDKAIEDWIRQNVNTTWHSCGTCAMKPLEHGGVVDKDLNVYGTQGLKVADLSIMPQNVGANTNNTALIVGEKTAVIIGSELGISV